LEGVDIRDRLLAYRADRGWSQAKTAEESGVAPATIAHIETGANKRPRRITLMRLAQSFGVSLDDFLSDGPPRAPHIQEAPQLQLEVLYEADAPTRRRALEAASPEEIERYIDTIDRVIRDVTRTTTPYEEIIDDKSKSEGERRVARTSLESLWRHISRLTSLRIEATGEDDTPPPQEEIAELIAHADVGAGT
jgi:transcriptional regulator with XRE-family HTH domain